MTIGKLHEIFKAVFPAGSVTTEDNNPYWVVTVSPVGLDSVFITTDMLRRIEQMVVKCRPLAFAVIPGGGIRFVFGPEELR